MNDPAAPAPVPHPVAAIHVPGLAERNGWRPEMFGASVNGVPLVAWWPTTTRPTRVVWAAIHGEEAVTLQLAQTLLRTVHADDACAVVVPVLNPDGVLLGCRQNANGVDLNRNFPGATWTDVPQPTYWPATTRRVTERRTQYSSTGTGPGSEPETSAIMALVERVQPEAVIDVHTPLECVLALSPESLELAAHLAEPSGMPVVDDLGGETPGDSGTWCRSQGAMTVTYETELAPLPELWPRHAESLARAIVERRGR